MASAHWRQGEIGGNMTLKESALTLARSTGLFELAKRRTASKLRILAYHGLWVMPREPFGECAFMRVELFEARMARLKRSGLPVLPLGEALERLCDDTLPDAAVVITIDDGWASTLTHMLPVLEAHELPATLYATTYYSGRDLPVVNVTVDYLKAAAGRPDIDRWAIVQEIDALPVDNRLEALRRFGAELGVPETWLERRQFHILTPAEIREAAGRGLDIQLHTHRHIDVEERVDELTADVEENRRFLTALLPEARLEHFCYPSGTWHPSAPVLLAAAGVRSATLDVEGLNAPNANPYLLRRFLDGQRVADVEFDAYLWGALHYAGAVRELVRRSRIQRQQAGVRQLPLHRHEPGRPLIGSSG